MTAPAKTGLEHSSLPSEIGELKNPQTDLPRIARDPRLTAVIESTVRGLPTQHDLYRNDARHMHFLARESVHLVVTSPPYWTLKEYEPGENQMGAIADYERFLDELDKVSRECARVLVPGGRICCVVGDRSASSSELPHKQRLRTTDNHQPTTYDLQPQITYSAPLPVSGDPFGMGSPNR